MLGDQCNLETDREDHPSDEAAAETGSKAVKDFSCDECDFITDWQQALYAHITKAHNNAPTFNCDRCPHAISYYSLLVRHVRYVHKRSRDYKCDRCAYTAPYCNNIRVHVKALHEDNPKFKCDSCAYTTPYTQGIKTHVQIMHDGRRAFRCDICHFDTKLIQSLKIHVSTMHEGARNFSCVRCAYWTTQSSHLKLHIRSVHDETKAFGCDRCDYASTQKSHLRSHILGVHRAEKPYSCDRCNQKSTLFGALKEHMKTVHYKIRAHHCDRCDYGASLGTTLHSHIQRIHEKNRVQLRCDMCDYRTSSTANLHEHFRKIHMKINIIFSCDRCDYSTKAAQQLRRHLAHDRCKEYRCPLCDYVTWRFGAVGVHVREVHKGFRCDRCSFSSVYQSGLIVHVTSCHDSREKHPGCAPKGLLTGQTRERKRELQLVQAESDEDLYLDLRCGKDQDKRLEANCTGAGRAKKKRRPLTDVSEGEGAKDRLLSLQCRQRKTHAKIDNMLSCDRCSYSTRSAQQLRRHSVSERCRGYQCPLCDYVTWRFGAVAAHIRDVHKGFRCDRCSFSSVNQSGLTVHVANCYSRRKDPGRAPGVRKPEYRKVDNEYFCTVAGCNLGYRFNSLYGLRKHFHGQHTGEEEKVFECDYCDAKFSFRTTRNKHVNAIHLKSYMCDICEKGFGSKDKMTHHRFTHTGEKPYACKKCSYRTAKQFNLDSHMESKHGVFRQKDFVCTVCNKQFVTMGRVRGHMARIHADGTEDNGFNGRSGGAPTRKRKRQPIVAQM